MSKERSYITANHPWNILPIEEIIDIVKIVKECNVIVKKRTKRRMKRRDIHRYCLKDIH